MDSRCIPRIYAETEMGGTCSEILHSKNVFVTLTYSLSFEMRHDSSCPVTFYTQNSYTHQWLQSHNYYRCGILPCYYSGNQVMWTSTDCFQFDMSACCPKCKSNGVPMTIMATMECCLLRNVTMHGLLLLLWNALYRVQCKK